MGVVVSVEHNRPPHVVIYQVLLVRERDEGVFSLDACSVPEPHIVQWLGELGSDF